MKHSLYFKKTAAEVTGNLHISPTGNICWQCYNTFIWCNAYLNNLQNIFEVLSVWTAECQTELTVSTTKDYHNPPSVLDMNIHL